MMKLTIFNSVIIHFSNVSALKGAFLKDPVWLDIQTGFIINLTEKNKTVKIHTQYTWPGNPNEIWLNRNRIYKNDTKEHHFFVTPIFFAIIFLYSSLKPLHTGSRSYPFSKFKMLFEPITSAGFTALMYMASLIFLRFQFFSLSR